MLILTRRPSKKLQIGNNIAVQVLEIKTKSIRLDFTMLTNTPIYHEEMYSTVHSIQDLPEMHIHALSALS
jgi:carbon storage regulator CsrA